MQIHAKQMREMIGGLVLRYLKVCGKCVCVTLLIVSSSAQFLCAQGFVDVDLAPGGVFHDGNLYLEAMKIGTGAAWFDANADGHLDLYVTKRLGPNLLYIGDGRGNFVESALQYGLRDSLGDGSGVAAADFNNDGYTDLYLANGKADRLFKNIGGSYFTDITASAGFDITNQSRGTSASWGDFNNDGYLDLYVANHNKIPNATNAQSQDRLYVNNGNETFTDVSNVLSATGIIDGFGFIGGWTDFDRDGDMDIILINDCFVYPGPPKGNQIFRNDGDTHPTLFWRFTEISDSLGVDYCENGMGLAIADYNRDGWMDHHYSNIGPSVLMKNINGGFTDVSTTAGVNNQPLPRYSWGTTFADVDLDGWPDLYLVLGAYHNPSSTDPQHNMFFHNNGNGINFSDQSVVMNLADSTKGRTVIAGDYDEDGDPDFAIVNYGEKILIKRNDIPQTHHFIKVDLQGVVSNRDGIGAFLTLITPDAQKQYWEMRSGSSLGGGDALTALFGLGDNTWVDTLMIAWPSGILQTVTNLPVDKTVKIIEFDPESAHIDFTNVAQSMGVDTTCGFCGVGNGVSFVDFDGDGLDDLTFGTQSGDSIRFYKNTGSGFIKLPSLVGNVYKQEQVLWVDLDNDGDKDLVVSSFNGQNKIYKNTGGLTLVDITTAAGIATQNDPSYGVSAADYDKDGDLDLYFANWSYQNVYTNYLYTNNADMTFTNSTTAAGVGDGFNLTFCSAFFDYDGDGWLDLYNSQDRWWSQNSLFKNNGDGTFTDVSVASGSNIGIDAMNAGPADYDLDGDFDIYVTNNPPGNYLMKNNGNGTFTNVGADVGVQMFKATWGANWLDADLDGDEDLYVSAMHMGGPCSSQLFINGYPQDTFSSMTFTGDSLNSWSNAIGDFNQDGLPDIAVNNGIPGDVSGCAPPGNPINKYHLWKNQSATGHHWLKIKLRGIESNRDGVGSLIKVFMDGQAYLRTTYCGIGYLAQNTYTEFFGLGTNVCVDSIHVIWSGSDHISKLYQVQGDQQITIYETDHVLVDVNAVGTGDGLTWSTAFPDLNTALQFAGTSHIKEIWIADGTYRPDLNDRAKSFNIPSGVQLYGGFAGTEVLLTQRNPLTNLVILSGDIGVLQDSTDNSYHVLNADIHGKGMSVDGIVIRGGYANGTNAQTKGAGVYCLGELTLKNVLIDHCFAAKGAAVYAEGVHAHVILDNVVTKDNTSSTGSDFSSMSSATIQVKGANEIKN